ncbi:MAG TPA: thiamine pyrophosphate-binding protein [Pseudomonadales bacterium]
MDDLAKTTAIATMAGNEILAETFRRAGTKAVFFVPTFLYPTLVTLGDLGIKRVLCHAEKAAGYMADGYAQAAGGPGIVITQGGPGATNLFAGLADAWQSHTPVIALTPEIPDVRYNGDSYQEVYVDFGTVTKFDAEVRMMHRLPEFLGKAYRKATCGAPRPVHLYIAGELEAMTLETDLGEVGDRYFRYPAFRPKADEVDVQKAAAMLRASKRPCVVAGRGAIASAAWKEITTLAERLEMPVTTSLGGKGSIDERHPLAMGVQGSYRRSSANDVIDEADLVLYVGSHIGGATTLLHTIPGPGVPIIHIDIEPSHPGMNYRTELPLVGDARTVVQQLLDALGPVDSAERAVWAETCRTKRAEWWKSHEKYTTTDASPIRPERLAVELTRALPEDAIVVADTGYAAAWSGAFLDLPEGKNFLACEGSLGWAFPAGIGAKAAQPDRPVVVWTGDGGFWVHFAELETAVRNEINVVTVILNNHALVFDTHLLQAFWSAEHDIDLLSEFRQVDFAEIAQRMGAFGVRVTDPNAIGEAVRQALAANKPGVVEVIIDHAAVAPVAFMAGQGSRGGMLKDPGKMK